MIILVRRAALMFAAALVASPRLHGQLDSSRTRPARAMLATMAPEARGHAERYLAALDTTERAKEAGWLATHPDGAEFVLAVVQAEPSPSIRQTLLIYTAQPFLPEAAYWFANPHVNDVLTSIMATDPDTTVITLASTFLQQRDAYQASTGLTHRLERMNDALASPHDSALWRVLTRLQETWAQAGYGIMLPAFLRQPPPVFAVPEVRGKARIRVVAFGDFGFDEETEADLARAGMHYTAWEAKVSAALHAYQARAVQAGTPFLFGITLGDNFYPQGMQSPTDPAWRRLWDDKYGNLGIPFYPCFGNHDWYDGDSPAAELLHRAANGSWRFPAQFYTYTAGPAQFFALDGNDLSARQLVWLKTELERSRARWKIVYAHFPPYFTTGRPKDAPSGTPVRTQDSTLVATLVPILRGRADVYIAGHSHTFQMFKPIDGVNYIIAGTGGAPLYDVDPTDPRLYYATATAGFTSLDIRGSAITVTFIGIDGKSLFTHTLEK